MAKKRKPTIEEMVEEHYDDPDVGAGILEHIAELGTTDKILAGELTLPSEHEASKFVPIYRESRKAK